MIGLREEFSGIHIQPFYRNYHLPQFNLTEKLGSGCEIIIPDFIIQEEAKGNYDVADFNNDEEKMLCTVTDTVVEDALMYDWVYAPRIYNEKVAYLCDLIPFKLITPAAEYKFLRTSSF